MLNSVFRRLVLLSLIALVSARSAAASEFLETADMRQVQTKAEQLGKTYGVQNVLVVFDIDNTIMTATTDLGSDQWFEWQDNLLKEKERSPQLVAENFAGLLEVQGVLFTLGHMKPTQLELPEIIGGLSKGGYPMMILTARGPEFREATQRELDANQLDFRTTAFLPEHDNAGTQLPYKLTDIQAAGLLPEEVQRFGLKQPRLVSYDDGLFMAAGQNKGAMLLTVLARVQRRMSAVIFVDDNPDNVRDVFDVLRVRDYDVTTFRYSRLDEQEQRFRDGEKETVTNQWRRIKELREATFPR